MLCMLLAALGCANKPDGPPDLPTRPNRMDTAYVDAVEEEDGINLAPRVNSLRLTGATDGDTPARVEVDAVDPEGAMVRSSYRWTVNGRSVDATSSVLDDSYFSAGHTLQATVTITDGEKSITRKTGQRTVGNQPPVISMRGARYSSFDGLQVEAYDPDGGSLSFRIEDAPPGMTIDSTGVLHWNGDVDTSGEWRPRVFVQDSAGDESAWEFGVKVTAGKKESKVKAPRGVPVLPEED